MSGWTGAVAEKPPEPRPAPPKARRQDRGGLSPEERARLYVATMPEAIAGQGGHDATFKVARKLVKDFELDAATALRILREDYNPRCQPPWSDRELQHKVESAMAARVANPVGDRPRRQALRPVNHDGEIIEPPPGRFDDEAPDAHPAGAITGRLFARGDQVELGEALIEQLRERGEVVFDDGQLYRYSDERHIFEPVSEAEQSRIVQAFAGSPSGDKGKPLALKRTDVTGAQRLAWDAVSDDGFFAGAPAGIVFADSFVEVTPQGCVPRPNAADHRARFAYAFDFASEPVPVRWLAFLGDSFLGDVDADDKVRLVQEYVGVSMLGLAPRYQRALIAHGPGGNGKSVMTTIIEAAMPPGSCAAIPPQDWGDEYRLAMLAGKRINVVSELPEADILAAESFKATISGESMTGRHIRQAPFTFRPVAGHVFSSNRLPGTNDQTHGFWRRMLVVEFNRKPAKEDPNLAETIVKSELPAIVSWFLQGAARVLARGMYTVPTSSANAVARWKSHSDQVRAFVEEWTTQLPADSPPSQWGRAADVYRAYRAWATENGHRPVASNTFGQRMDAIGLRSKHTESGNRYPVHTERRFGGEDA